MGYLNDLGTSIVEDICPVTGYPRDRYGHLLRTIDMRDGRVVENWDKPKTELYNLTSPYGHLHFATGSGDDFYCYDYAVINAGPRGRFIILHATVNSETGCFIQGAGYHVLSSNTEEECRTAARAAFDMMDCMEGVTHSKRGWNQDSQYFGRAVAHALFKSEFERWNKRTETWSDWATDRMLRFGGKKIDEVIHEILWPPEQVAPKSKKRRPK